MYTKVPAADEGLFYTQQIDFEPEVVVEVEEDDNFDEYLWMEDEEEFEKTEMQRLEEEALMEECVEAMLNDEEEQEQQENILNMEQLLSSTIITTGKETLSVAQSTLNPLAIEFIPAN